MKVYDIYVNDILLGQNIYMDPEDTTAENLSLALRMNGEYPEVARLIELGAKVDFKEVVYDKKQ